jgi:hypothetical protein
VTAIVILVIVATALAGALVVREEDPSRRVEAPPSSEEPALTSRSRATQLVDRLLRVMKDGDPGAIAAVYTPDAELTVRSMNGTRTYVGAETIATLKSEQESRDQAGRIGPVVAIGDQVVFSYTYREEAWRTIIWLQGTSVVSFDGDLIEREWDYGPFTMPNAHG